MAVSCSNAFLGGVGSGAKKVVVEFVEFAVVALQVAGVAANGVIGVVQRLLQRAPFVGEAVGDGLQVAAGGCQLVLFRRDLFVLGFECFLGVDDALIGVGDFGGNAAVILQRLFAALAEARQ